MNTVQPDPPALNRRGLFLGAGAVALAATTLSSAEPATAKPPGGHRDGAVQTDGSPITTTIASAPIGGFTYRSVCMYDFEPFNPAAQKTWGGNGIYSAGTSSAMRATLEIPAGALVRDVEFYVDNSSGSSRAAEAWLYVPGQGVIHSLTAVSIASDSKITATRGVVSSTNQGPYPSGSRLLVGLTTPTDATVQINGARVGFSQGTGEIGLLGAPVRVYDSRNTSKLAAGVTRTIFLNSQVVIDGAFNPVTPGTTGVLINVSAFQSAGKGFLKVWSASEPEPSASALNFDAAGDSIANMIAVGVSDAGEIKVKSSQAVHVTVDITGTVG